MIEADDWGKKPQYMAKNFLRDTISKVGFSSISSYLSSL